MVFKINFAIPETLNFSKLEAYTNYLNLNGKIIVWGIEEDEGDDNLLGYVDMITPAMVIRIKPTISSERLEGRIAHEITHISLTIKGYRGLSYHNGPISSEKMYDEFLNQFVNFLHHIILYQEIRIAGFSLEDDLDIVQRYYKDPLNINKMKDAYFSGDRFAKAWVVVSLMNDLIRLSDRNDLYLLIKEDLSEALTEAEGLLQEIGEVCNLEDYKQTKLTIEQKFNLPSFDFD